MSNTYIVGLTGGIGAGKSTVARFFIDLHINLIDADLIAREAVAKGSTGLNEIVAHFGKAILLENGDLNRAKLREIIFSEPSQKQWLNDLLHPLIRQEILYQLAQAKSAYVLLDAPLLFENKLNLLCQQSIVVDIPEQLQLQRAAKRDDVDIKQIEKIIAAQMPRSEKLALADEIIDNSQDLEHTKKQVLTLHQKILEQI